MLLSRIPLENPTRSRDDGGATPAPLPAPSATRVRPGLRPGDGACGTRLQDLQAAQVRTWAPVLPTPMPRSLSAQSTLAHGPTAPPTAFTLQPKLLPRPNLVRATTGAVPRRAAPRHPLLLTRLPESQVLPLPCKQHMMRPQLTRQVQARKTNRFCQQNTENVLRWVVPGPLLAPSSCRLGDTCSPPRPRRGHGRGHRGRLYPERSAEAEPGPAPTLTDSCHFSDAEKGTGSGPRAAVQGVKTGDRSNTVRLESATPPHVRPRAPHSPPPADAPPARRSGPDSRVLLGDGAASPALSPLTLSTQTAGPWDGGWPFRNLNAEGSSRETHTPPVRLSL